MNSMNEYFRMEAEFASRTDSLCCDARPGECNCAQCPTMELCAWLINHDPFAQGGRA